MCRLCARPFFLSLSSHCSHAARRHAHRRVDAYVAFEGKEKGLSRAQCEDAVLRFLQKKALLSEGGVDPNDPQTIVTFALLGVVVLRVKGCLLLPLPQLSAASPLGHRCALRGAVQGRLKTRNCLAQHPLNGRAVACRRRARHVGLHPSS